MSKFNFETYTMDSYNNFTTIYMKADNKFYPCDPIYPKKHTYMSTYTQLKYFDQAYIINYEDTTAKGQCNKGCESIIEGETKICNEKYCDSSQYG